MSLRTTALVGLVVIAGAGVLLARPRVLNHATALLEPLPSVVALPPAADAPPTSVAPFVSEHVRKVATEPVRRPVAVITKAAPPRSEPGRCWTMDRAGKILTLRVLRGQTLSDLAVHFDTTAAQLRRMNPGLRGSTLLAGHAYKMPIDHLAALEHRVVPSDTMWELGRLVDAPTDRSVRAWNCLDSSELHPGDEILLLRSRREARR